LRKFSRKETGMGGLSGRARLVWLVLLAVVATLPGAAAAQEASPDVAGGEVPSFRPQKEDPGREVVPGQIIVKYREDVGAAAQAAVRREEDLAKERDLDIINADVVEVEGRSVRQAIGDLEDDPDVAYATPDRVVHPMAYEDEQRFGELWGLRNEGQTILGEPGLADSDTNATDVDAEEAAGTSSGGDGVVVAVIDDGVDFDHPDLEGHEWVNGGEIANNNIDDDDNGYIDDVNGYDFANDDNTVHDTLQDFHGTHVAGTIAASANGTDVVGVAPNVEIMALKFLGGPFTAESTAIEAIEYAKKEGARISNNSWGFESEPVTGPDPLRQAIERSGMLFVASAGNGGFDGVGDNNDRSRFEKAYPASYPSSNILSVAAANNMGELAEFSNFGPRSVDLTAPGVDVLSTVPSVPARSGLTLSQVGGTLGGQALVAGFGIEEIGDEAARTEFADDALTTLDHTGSESVLLVDDDASSLDVPPEEAEFAFPDVGESIQEALTSAGATDVDVHVVGDEDGEVDGPTFDQLQAYDHVVWATGWAFVSGDVFDFEAPVKKNLTFADQNALTRYLNGGGNLLLTGMDALYLGEETAFVTDTLGLKVQSDYYTGVFTGEAGEFAGDTHGLDNPTFAIPFFHDIVEPAETYASSLGTVGTPRGYEEYFSGTSMAAPHATGVAALAAGEFQGLEDSPTALKRLVMATGEPLASTRGKTVTGDMVNAGGAVTDTSPQITAVSPMGTITDNTPRIKATISDLQGEILRSNVGLFVDGDPKTSFSYNEETGALSYTGRVGNGRHTVRVTATDGQTDPAEKRWSFKVE
jgi:subtilisin family serine protease